MNLSQHGVISIELCTRYTSNDNQRTIRITSRSWVNGEYVPEVTQITFYGATNALEMLPISPDFTSHGDQPATAPSPQVDIEDYLAGTKPPVDQELAGLDAAEALADKDETEIEF